MRLLRALLAPTLLAPLLGRMLAEPGPLVPAVPAPSIGLAVEDGGSLLLEV